MLGKNITCKNNRFKYTIKVIHQDGSLFVFENAFVELKKEKKCELLLIYTEHCGYHYFYINDLESWRKFTTIIYEN